MASRLGASEPMLVPSVPLKLGPGGERTILDRALRIVETVLMDTSVSKRFVGTLMLT